MIGRISAALVATALLAVVAFPPEFVRVWERSKAAELVRAGSLEQAQWVYWVLRLQRDPIGNSNYHALRYHASINAGRDIRKEATKSAIGAWKETGAAGVGASYWNIAMFSVNYGQDNRKERDKNTSWLERAAKAGIDDADRLLSAGNQDLDRVMVLMNDGDPGAALTWKEKPGLSLTEKHDALRIAANAGHHQAMRELGWSLILNSEAEYQEAEKWLVKAAEAGETQAANRLGNCHNHKFYFCLERDVSEAIKWYEVALKPPLLFTPPVIKLDADHAIRLGTMPRWYSKPYGHQENAAYELARLLIDGDGIEQDLVRAEKLLIRAGEWKKAKKLLSELSALQESLKDS
ncbi:hypothetical protein ABVF61_20605 [Roseibium sp. HPY-6]|uniref:tetratricopeptide repeat protein n=1 Tax=Roseibium sp. HPY-6 TaxID=3229852 RepID=UPI00339038F0